MKFPLKVLIFLSVFLFLSSIFHQSANAHYVIDTEPLSSSENIFGGAYLQFANKMGGKISAAAIADQKELGVAGCAAGSRIFQFTLYVKKDGKRSSYTSKSHVLSKEMIKKLSSLSAGDEFEFKRIKAYLPKKAGVVDVHSNKFIVV